MLLIFLAATGLVFLITTLYIVIRLLFSLRSNCDFDTATLSSAPASAFNNQVAWITGASSGLGREMALQLAARNAKLILSSRRVEALQEVEAQCKERNGAVQIDILPLDLSDLDSLKPKAEQALKLHGRIDVLFNNGGVSTRSTARNSSFQVDVMLANVDYLSHVLITKTLLPSMEQNPNGATIINTGSVCSKLGVPVRTAYCGAKHALLGWSDALRIEQTIQKYDVHILNVILGSTKTDVAQNAITSSPDASFQQLDPNIESGLDAKIVVERMIAAAYHKKDEIWLAKSKELALCYLHQYFPATSKKILTNVAGKQYMVEKQMKDDE